MKNDLKKLLVVLNDEYEITLPKTKTKKVYVTGTRNDGWYETVNCANFGDFTVEEMPVYNTNMENRFIITPNFDPAMWGKKYEKMFTRRYYTVVGAKRFIVKNCYGVR